eukprot:m.294758 g.294758  ORF g.294758 m.294758 type:complete len:328 (-) comp13056_c0_seq1:147-1130(-)
MGRLPTPPDALKGIARGLETADAFDKRDPIVAYQLRLHALEKSIAGHASDPACLPFLNSLMTLVEQDKQRLLASDKDALLPAVTHAAVWNVAIRLFALADREDRAGRADKRVAHSFLTVKTLLEAIDRDVDTEEKYKYALWKAAYIAKCLREGITPVPGPVDEFGNPIPEPGAEDELGDFEGGDGAAAAPDPMASLPSIPPAAQSPQSPQPHQAPPSQPAGPSFHLPEPPTAHPGGPSSGGAAAAPAYRPAPAYKPPPAAAAAPPPAAAPPAATGGGSGGSRVRPDISFQDNDKAAKFCKYAISALQYNDYNTAVDNLRKALGLLTH